MGIFKSREYLELRYVDTSKRYDIYFNVGESLTCLRDVKLEGVRTYEKIDPEDSSYPINSFVEVVDARGSTILVDASDLTMLCESGASFHLTRVPVM